MCLVEKGSTYFMLFPLLLQKGILGSSLTLTGHITHDSEFYYREFLTFPPMVATIKYHISYNYTTDNPQCFSCYPKLDIYTTKSDANLERNCSVDEFGQLRNENLHTPLRPRDRLYRFTNCTKEIRGIVHCRGETKIQDYIPRNYGFSFGFRCEEIKRSLKGLQYNMTIHSQTNETQCQSMAAVELRTEMSAKRYWHMSLPNLVGSPNLNYLKENVLSTAVYVELFVEMSPLIFNKLEKCYPYFYESLCYVVFPECDPETKRIIHPCKEMCEELREGCTESATVALEILAAGKQIMYNWSLALERGLSTWFDCDYLPSENGTIPCIYKPVTCKPPPNIMNAVISGRNETYEALSAVNYSCESNKFRMEGNNTVTCQYSGEWSELPQCVKNSVTPLVIVLPVLIFPLLTLGMILIRYLCLGKRQLYRNKKFDAFVCYNFDTDHKYVTDIILPELEEKHDPPCKLCFDSQDFKPGVHIKENIKEAVTNSNSAIVVLSQGFVDSIWCREEFSDCYIENMKDSAFRLFVIMMQPVENLENVSEYMNSFFEKKTYLLKDDPQLFPKIGEYLEGVKKPKRRKNSGEEEEEEDAPEIDQLL